MAQTATGEKISISDGKNNQTGVIDFYEEAGERLVYFELEEIAERNASGKRWVDLILGCLALVGLCIAFPFIALGIKLSSRGPVLFKQPRTGYRGETFTCYKFRTMHIVQKNSVQGRPVITEKGDPRIFAFGQWLRRMNLDELPQIINIIKGDMSLVGPRPYPVEEATYWDNLFPEFFKRHAVKPGLSGLAQVKGYRGGTLDTAHMDRRLEWDLYYVKNMDIKMDTYVMWHTVLQMLKFETNAH